MANRRRDFRSFCGATERIRNVQQQQTQQPIFSGGVRSWTNRCGRLLPRCHNADAAAARQDETWRRLQSTGDTKEPGEQEKHVRVR